MSVLLIVLVSYVVAGLLLIGCASGALPLPDALRVLAIVLCILWLALGWITLLGLKVIRPQEALVLTLFGKYVGTLKGEGFYHVNPFCVAVNPAAATKLNQSGDVDSAESGGIQFRLNTDNVQLLPENKKISMKIMKSPRE